MSKWRLEPDAHCGWVLYQHGFYATRGDRGWQLGDLAEAYEFRSEYTASRLAKRLRPTFDFTAIRDPRL